jgi:hypothetical protein
MLQASIHTGHRSMCRRCRWSLKYFIMETNAIRYALRHALGQAVVRSGRARSGQSGSGRAGSRRAGSGGRMGSGRAGSGLSGSGRVTTRVTHVWLYFAAATPTAAWSHSHRLPPPSSPTIVHPPVALPVPLPTRSAAATSTAVWSRLVPLPPPSHCHTSRFKKDNEPLPLNPPRSLFPRMTTEP